MNFPFELLLFGVAFFGLLVVVAVVQAYRKKEKEYYLAAMISFMVILAFAFAFLSQPILAFLIMIAAAICSIARLPRMLKIQERELTKRLQKVDFSVPLRKRYFFSDIWWLKLASKWGLFKTMSLFYLISMMIVGRMLFVLSTFMPFMTTEYIVVYTTTSSILFTFMFYQQFKKGMKKTVEYK